MHREKRPRPGSALVLLAASLTVAAASWSASAAAGAPAARTGLSVVAPARVASGGVVRVVVPESFESVSGRLCNTDPAIPERGSGCSAGVTGRRSHDGRVEYDVPIRLGRIGASDLAFCPPTPSLNSPDADCTIVIETRDGPVVAAYVVARSGDGTTDSQQIGVVVEREATVTTVGSTVPGSTTTTTTTYSPPTTGGLTGPSVVTIGGSGTSAGPGGSGGGAMPRGPLASTGPARAISLTALAVALVDLGWLLSTAARSRERMVFATASS